MQTGLLHFHSYSNNAHTHGTLERYCGIAFSFSSLHSHFNTVPCEDALLLSGQSVELTWAFARASGLARSVCQAQGTVVRAGLSRKPQQRALTPNTSALTLQQASSHCCLRSWPRLRVLRSHRLKRQSTSLSLSLHTARQSGSDTAAFGLSPTEKWATRSPLALNSFQKSRNWMRACLSINAHIHWNPILAVSLGSSRKFGIIMIHRVVS